MQLEYFKLVDRIIAIDTAARTIEVECNVPNESPIFEGHFPGHPLMPGVMLVECMAQASGWLIIGLTDFTRMPFFAAVNEAKFRSFVTPGTALKVSASIEQEGSGYFATRAAIRNGEKLVCNSALRFRLTPWPSPGFRAAMDAMAAAIAFPSELKADA